jgi:phage tail-like protein
VTSTGQRVEPHLNFVFQVIVDGLSGAAAFSEVAGLEASMKPDEVRAGGENDFVYRLPTRTEFGNLTLRRGWVDPAFFRWLLERAEHPTLSNRKNVTVNLVDRRTKNPVPGASWTFARAFPVKWSGPNLKAAENAIAIESVELAHHGFLSSAQRQIGAG